MLNWKGVMAEVWFRSISFLFMGDGCRFQPLIFACTSWICALRLHDTLISSIRTQGWQNGTGNLGAWQHAKWQRAVISRYQFRNDTNKNPSETSEIDPQAMSHSWPMSKDLGWQSSRWSGLIERVGTPLKIKMEHNHGGLVQIIFLSFHGWWL